MNGDRVRIFLKSGAQPIETLSTPICGRQTQTAPVAGRTRDSIGQRCNRERAWAQGSATFAGKMKPRHAAFCLCVPSASVPPPINTCVSSAPIRKARHSQPPFGAINIQPFGRCTSSAPIITGMSRAAVTRTAMPSAARARRPARRRKRDDRPAREAVRSEKSSRARGCECRELCQGGRMHDGD